MTEAPVLSMPDFDLPFELETDASNYAIGAVLLQQNHPIAFFSKKLSTQMCSASTYVGELFAIIEAVAKWRHYLLGRQFIIKTNHRSLKHLMDHVIQTPKQHHYLSKLLGFNYTIVYKPGRDNVVADALSRVVGEQFSDNPAPVTNQMLMSNGLYFALSTISSILLEKLRLEVLQNSELQSLVQDCEVGIATNYAFRDGLLFYKDKLRIASYSDLKMVILKEFHSTPIGGHAGILKTFMRIYPNFYCMV